MSFTGILYIGANFYVHMRKVLFLLLPSMAALSASAQNLGCSTIEQHAVTKKEVRLTSLDTSKSRGMADNYFLWNNGSTITVKFLTGSPALQQRVMAVAKQWEHYANIRFNFVSSGPANIRVRLSEGEGHYSYLGTYCNLIDQAKETLVLDTTDLVSQPAFQGTVLHEFGHALGLLHEHFSPISGIRWNKEKLYESYRKTQGWDKNQVDYQVFRTYNQSYTNGTSYDKKSIMHYPIYSWETLDGYSVPWNRSLSSGDKELIAALYPKRGKRQNEVTRVTIQNYTQLQIERNDKKGGLSLFPVFDLVAEGRKGNVVLLTEFFDGEGYPLIDTDGSYRFGEQVSAIRTITAIPGKKVDYNQKKKKDFEIFIPYDQLELPSGSKDIYIRFRAVIQTEEGEIRDLFTGSARSYSISS